MLLYYPLVYEVIIGWFLSLFATTASVQAIVSNWNAKGKFQVYSYLYGSSNEMWSSWFYKVGIRRMYKYQYQSRIPCSNGLLFFMGTVWPCMMHPTRQNSGDLYRKKHYFRAETWCNLVGCSWCKINYPTHKIQLSIYVVFFSRLKKDWWWQIWPFNQTKKEKCCFSFPSIRSKIHKWIWEMWKKSTDTYVPISIHYINV